MQAAFSNIKYSKDKYLLVCLSCLHFLNISMFLEKDFGVEYESNIFQLLLFRILFHTLYWLYFSEI